MGSVDDRLKELGIELPDPPDPIANYVPSVRTGNLLYLAGTGPAADETGAIPLGKLGEDMTIEQGYAAARLTGMNVIGRLKKDLGSLDRVKRVVKLLSMVNCTGDFVDQPAVANGASDLLVEVFGDKGKHARSAVGMASLPGRIPVEIEAIVEVE